MNVSVNELWEMVMDREAWRAAIHGVAKSRTSLSDFTFTFKGIFHAKMGTIKDRNSMDLTEAEDIRRGGKNTQKNYTKKILVTQIAMMV